MFDSKNVGFGQKHPQIEIGALGYFANDFPVLKKAVEEKNRFMFGTVIPEDADNGTVIYRQNKVPGSYKFFYLDSPVKTVVFEPLGVEAILKHVKMQSSIRLKNSGLVHDFKGVYISDCEVIVEVRNEYEDVQYTPQELLDKFEFLDGSAVGVEKENGD